MEKPNSVTATQAVHVRNKLPDKESEVVEKEVEELLQWIDMIEGMNDYQLKNYVTNRPTHLNSRNRPRFTTCRKARPNIKGKSSNQMGIMASVWKFHQEEDDDVSSSHV